MVYQKYIRYLIVIIILTFITLFSCSEEKGSSIKLVNDLLEIASNKKEPLLIRKNSLSKAYEIYPLLKNNIEKRKVAEQISILFYQFKERELSRKMDVEMLEISKSIKDSVGIAKSYAFYGIYYRQKKNIDSAFSNFYKAESIYRSIEKNKTISSKEYAFDYGKTLLDLAKLSRKFKDYTESEKYIIESLEKFHLADRNDYIPMSYTNLGIISKYTEKYEEAINYHLKSVEIGKLTEDSEMYTVSAFNNIGTIYKAMNQYDKAMRFYEKGLEHTSYLVSNPSTKARLLDNLGYVKFLANSNDRESLILMNQSFAIRDSLKYIEDLATSHIHFAEYYKRKGQKSLSLKHALEAKEICHNENKTEELLQAYQLLSEVSEPKTGLEYAQKYIALNDSLIKEERLYRDKFARIRFETDQKEQQIIKVQNQNTVYLLGMLLLLSLIGFALFFFRQRTKYLAQQNKIVQTRAAYETETRISKRLHDELGNDIFQVML
ncbi:MAG: hypothetical protein CL613_05255, partial [Aquimarina sp.]|nr:hypothetical protein [Aquimarina sp.]